MLHVGRGAHLDSCGEADATVDQAVPPQKPLRADARRAHRSSAVLSWPSYNSPGVEGGGTNPGNDTTRRLAARRGGAGRGRREADHLAAEDGESLAIGPVAAAGASEKATRAGIWGARIRLAFRDCSMPALILDNFS